MLFVHSCVFYLVRHTRSRWCIPKSADAKRSLHNAPSVSARSISDDFESMTSSRRDFESILSSNDEGLDQTAPAGRTVPASGGYAMRRSKAPDPAFLNNRVPTSGVFVYNAVRKTDRLRRR